jgi:methionyl aminopeptidase
MIHYKSKEEIELIRESCLLVSKTLTLVAENISFSNTGKHLDALAEEFIRDHGAVPGFKGYGGFPATLCISKNENVVHGIPEDKPFKEGDIVSIDCGVFMNGFYGDCAYTFVFEGAAKETVKLCRVTNAALYSAIDKVREGNRLGDIGFAVQNLTEKQNNYSVVRELVGHGIGRNLHEDPQVPNYGRRGKGRKLEKGLVIAIEPMINLGGKNVVKSEDGWTIFAKDRKPSAHYEHSVAVTDEDPDILSDHKIIEDQIKKNRNLMDISIKK